MLILGTDYNQKQYYQQFQLIAINNSAIIQIMKIKSKTDLFAFCTNNDRFNGAHELIIIDGPTSVFIKYIKQAIRNFPVCNIQAILKF